MFFFQAEEDIRDVGVTGVQTCALPIFGWARRLQEMNLDGETARRGLEIIERNAEAQNQLVRDLLDVSRIITGKLRLETTSVELAPVVESALDSVRQAAEAKDRSEERRVGKECRSRWSP